MIGAKLVVCSFVIICLISSKLLIRAEEKVNNNTQVGLNKTRVLNIFPGVWFSVTDNKVVVHMTICDLIKKETEVEGRKQGEEKKNPLKNIGFMMMMTPFVMQILSLPGAIATIKMSLLRSIMVAQLAIAIMIYNLIKSTSNQEVVVVHQPQHHAHYYHKDNYYYPEDEEHEWFGR
ncbi:uncharacterized protein LOC109853552 [Pseudomyrmex gracilis]|uniref:uncharacterized protein LOC109853552 n=1 Tax=Pseudomyrmex gracilis TaxID=219809 RepID=UPI000994D0B4|nr:uncharacterized protein LOC109853552 [Pseudomyrmex gracilis]